VSEVVVFLIVAGFIFGGALLGLFLQRLLPSHHLGKDSHEIVKLGAGMIATLTALVLGLLVSSAKGTFDTTSAGIVQSGAKIILLDRTLSAYGPETKASREQLRRTVAAGIETIWPEEKTGVSGLSVFERANGMELVQGKLRELTPRDDAQRQLLSQAQQLVGDLLHNRWLLIEQMQNELPRPFLVVLVFWLTMLFASFGLFAPRNRTVITVLLICACSVSAAIFLVLEMNQPLDGSIKVSSAPMLKALEHLGR
jgi:hypothetical protein